MVGVRQLAAACEAAGRYMWVAAELVGGQSESRPNKAYSIYDTLSGSPSHDRVRAESARMDKRRHALAGHARSSR
jgi:hypothetical protein